MEKSEVSIESDTKQNGAKGSEKSNPSIFKITARQNFKAILRQEIESQNQVSLLPIETESAKGPQSIRIIDNKITTISEPLKTKLPDLEISVFKKAHGSNPKPVKHLKESQKQYYTFNEININHESLHCINYDYLTDEKATKINKKSKQNLPNQEDEVYRCYLCPFFNTDPTSIAQHWINVHLTKDLYCCPYCSHTTQTNFKMLCHLKLSHPSRSHRVLIKKSDYFKTRVSFDFREELTAKDPDQRPLCMRNDAVKIKCHKCGLSCHTLSQLEDHMKLPHLEFKSLFCGCCEPPMLFHCSENLQYHIQKMQGFGRKPQKNKISINVDVSSNFFYIGNTMHCNKCSFKTTQKAEIIIHQMNSHGIPKTYFCGGCCKSFDLQMHNIKSEKATCKSCFTVNLFKFIVPKEPKEKRSVYYCNLCSFSFKDKEILIKHLKLRHLNFRPFVCAYCNFSAINIFLFSAHHDKNHPGEVQNYTRDPYPQDNIKETIKALFKSVVKILTGEQTLNQTGVNKMILQKNSSPKDKIEYFRCLICDYQCLDRSSISRHAKYRHLDSRPHSCPYCPYNNVEKTKVRLHVMSQHPLLPKLVRTNRHTLEQMATEARKFYIKVDGHMQPEQSDSKIANAEAGNVELNELLYLTDEDFKCLDDGDDDDPTEFIDSNNEFNGNSVSIGPMRSTDASNDNNCVEIADMRSSGQLKIKIKKEDDRFSIVRKMPDEEMNFVNDDTNDEHSSPSEMSSFKTESVQNAVNSVSKRDDHEMEFTLDTSLTNSQFEESKHQPISELTSSINKNNFFKENLLGYVTMNNIEQNSFMDNQMFKRSKKRDIKILRSRNKKRVENPDSFNNITEKKICLKDRILEDVGKHEELKFLTKMRMSGLTISPEVLKDRKISKMFPLIRLSRLPSQKV